MNFPGAKGELESHLCGERPACPMSHSAKAILIEQEMQS